MNNRCSALTRTGSQCKQGCANHLDTCWVHSDTCSVCLEKLGTKDEVARVSCGHHFHAGCIDKWWHTGKCRCPLCRAKIFEPSEIVLVVPDQFYDHPNLCSFIQGQLNSGKLTGDRLIVEHDSAARTLVVLDELTRDCFCGLLKK